MENGDRHYPTELIGFWVNRLAMALRARLDERAREFELAGTEALLLTMLYFKRSVSLVELSQIMSLAHPSVLRHVDSLEERGLIERTPHPHDRRIKLMTLTDAGREMERHVNRMLTELHREAVRGISNDDLERTFTVLGQVTRNVGGPLWLPPPQAYPPGEEPAEYGTFTGTPGREDG
ncbi:MAG: Transcriptional regulator SlyA [Calditrichaeota bacterium]|nr:Transcriptional regulator SlyA [Calditrichota bacterium]